VTHTYTLHKIGSVLQMWAFAKAIPIPPSLSQRQIVYSPSIGNAFRSSCYWATVNSSADRACVFTIADFSINFARAGTQTHMDLSELPRYLDWEPIVMRTNSAIVNRAKRLMGCPP
jgi:hypothetical protein